MKVIIEYLKKQKTNAWQLRKIYKESSEVYAVDQKIEALRCNTVVDYSVLIHRDTNKDGFIGESRSDFQLLPKTWKTIINETIERADIVQNPMYDLAPSIEIFTNNNPIYDTSFDKNLQDEIIKIYEQLLTLTPQQLYGCHLVSFEVFLEKYISNLVNYNGLNIRIPSSKVVLDFVLLSKNREYELNYYGKRRFLKQYNFLKLIQNEALQLEELNFSELPPTGNFSVVMADEALDTLFDYFIGQADGNALYYKYSSFKQGESIYTKNATAKEPLTLYSDPNLEGGMSSGYVDDLGFPLKPITLIDNGILKNFTLSGKVASLLKQNITSAMACVSVKAGNTCYNDFLQDGVLELLRFSTFHPNHITGAFSGEIRFGYLHKDGKKIPIKGGSVSGISQDAFLKCSFSKEVEMRENYHGPKGVFFETLTLAGK